MSLRGAKISLSGNVCTIVAQSKIAKSTFELVENQAILLAGLKGM